MSRLLGHALLDLARQRQAELHAECDRRRLTARKDELAAPGDRDASAVRWMAAVQGFLAAPALDRPLPQPRARTSR